MRRSEAQNVDQRFLVAEDRRDGADRLQRGRKAVVVQDQRRDLPDREQAEAGQQRRGALRRWRAPTSWLQLVFAGVVDHALDVDDVFLVARIEQQLGAAARPRQVDIDDLPDAAGRARHHHDLVGEEHRLLDRMGDEQHRLAVALPDVEQVVLQPRAGMRIERAERLVHQQHFGMIGQRARQRDALLHAAGQFLRIEILKALEADHLDQRAALRFGFAQASRPAGADRTSRCRARSSRETARTPGTPARDPDPGP